MKKKLQINPWFGYGLLSALTVSAIASVPRNQSSSSKASINASVKSSMIESEQVSEIKVSKESEMSQEPYIQRLTQIRPRYVERVKVTQSSVRKTDSKKSKKSK